MGAMQITTDQWEKTILGSTCYEAKLQIHMQNRTVQNEKQLQVLIGMLGKSH